jgi:ATP-binding cassette subfamily G (WHITE) protein 2 (PDR)
MVGSDKPPVAKQSRESEHPTWSKKWRESQQHHEAQQYLQQSTTTKHSTVLDKLSIGPGQSEYAASSIQQLIIVTRRIFQDYWRDLTYLYSKLALCAGVVGVLPQPLSRITFLISLQCFFNSISFYKTSLDMQGFVNFLFSIFPITQLFSTLDQQIIPRLANGRGLFETRERKSKSYSWITFLTANIVVELFWQTVSSVIIFISWYYPTDLWHNSDPTFGVVNGESLIFVLIWLFCLWITTFSQAVGVGIEHAETAVQIATLCFWLSLVFCG